MAGFAGQSGIECDSRQKDPAFRMSGIPRDKAPGGLGPRQFIRFRRQREGRQIGVGGAFPGVRDARLSPLFMAGYKQPARIGKRGRSKPRVLLPCLLRETEGAGGIGFRISRRDGCIGASSPRMKWAICGSRC